MAVIIRFTKPGTRVWSSVVGQTIEEAAGYLVPGGGRPAYLVVGHCEWSRDDSLAPEPAVMISPDCPPDCSRRRAALYTTRGQGQELLDCTVPAECKPGVYVL